MNTQEGLRTYAGMTGADVLRGGIAPAATPERGTHQYSEEPAEIEELPMSKYRRDEFSTPSGVPSLKKRPGSGRSSGRSNYFERHFTEGGAASRVPEQDLPALPPAPTGLSRGVLPNSASSTLRSQWEGTLHQPPGLYSRELEQEDIADPLDPRIDNEIVSALNFALELAGRNPGRCASQLELSLLRDLNHALGVPRLLGVYDQVARAERGKQLFPPLR